MDFGSNRQQVLDMLEAQPASKGWNLEILPVTSKNETIKFKKLGGLRIAPPLQVYLDLLHDGKKKKKIAQHFREAILGVEC